MTEQEFVPKLSLVTQQLFEKEEHGDEKVLSFSPKYDLTREVVNYIDEHNRTFRKGVKFFPQVDARSNYLYGISVRFPFSMDRCIDSAKEEAIYQKISSLSRKRLFCARDGLLTCGVLELKISHVHLSCPSRDIINSLEYIKDNIYGLVVLDEPL